MRKILVLGTGGTISCKRSENGLTPAISASELVKDLKIPADIHTEQLFELDSTNMTPRHWEAIARRIRDRYDEFDGFVVTHGTDTMAYAAASLACLIQNSRKPVVFTGSMKPMSAEGSDAPRNLRDAVDYAADGRAFGVRVVFAGSVFDARDVRKADSVSERAFVDSKSAFVPDFRKERRDGIPEKFSGETRFYERLSDDVFHVKLIPGQRLCVPENARAVILEGYGAGGVPEYILGDVERLAEKGVYVMIATQCNYGGTKLRTYEVGRVAAERFSLLETGRMTVEYAVARARWALEYSKGSEEFQRLFCDTDYIDQN